MAFETAEEKLTELESRIATLEATTCPQQEVLDDLLARVTALEAKPADLADPVHIMREEYTT